MSMSVLVALLVVDRLPVELLVFRFDVLRLGLPRLRRLSWIVLVLMVLLE